MIPAETIRQQLEEIGISQVRAAAVIGISERAMRNYVAKGAPQLVFDALERYRRDPAALRDRLRVLGLTIRGGNDDASET